MLLRSILNKVTLHPDGRNKGGYLFFNQINFKDSIIYSLLNYEEIVDRVNDETDPFKINYTLLDKEAYYFIEDRLIYSKFYKDGKWTYQYFNAKFINENVLKVIIFQIDKEKHLLPILIVEVSMTTLQPEITIRSDLIQDSDINETVRYAFSVITLLNFLLKTYDTIEKTISVSEQRKGNVKKSDVPLYSEYTLDLTSPKTVYNSLPLGGTHESPREHYRREHIRRYKSGKVVHVQGSIVNKGSVKGKVVKEYNVNHS